MPPRSSGVIYRVGLGTLSQQGSGGWQEGWQQVGGQCLPLSGHRPCPWGQSYMAVGPHWWDGSRPHWEGSAARVRGESPCALDISGAPGSWAGEAQFWEDVC